MPAPHSAAPPAPGARNALTDVPGLSVGHAVDRTLLTGVTVVLPDTPAVAACDVRGGGPGTRETDALAAGNTVQTVDAVVLSGGSAYGLDAAGGAMDWLRRAGRGYAVGAERVPIVPAAILFDLLTPGPRDWSEPPWWRLGGEAAGAAGLSVAEGNVGAGLGAKAGAIKGGTGTASLVTDDGIVGALAAVNPLGSVVMPGTRHFWAWWLEMQGELGGLAPPDARPDLALPAGPAPSPRTGTTLAVVATDATLTRPELRRLAVMAQDGLARAIRPLHSPFDGDTVFALSTARRAAPEGPEGLARLGAHAADTLARAVMRGVHRAEPVDGIPAWRDLAP